MAQPTPKADALRRMREARHERRKREDEIDAAIARGRLDGLLTGRDKLVPADKLDLDGDRPRKRPKKKGKLPKQPKRPPTKTRGDKAP
jgi:hypothetical protein